MTLEELILRVPEGLRPVASQYGPALLAMTSAELWAWIEKMLAGDTRAAYEALVKRLPNADLMAAMQANLAKWDEANTANAAKLELQRSAGVAILKACLAIVMAMLGF